jgi:hypothetical protein
MCGERPHFGPINPLWDYIPTFHSYVARLGYALSCGQPAIDTALYFPVRDTWARGVRGEAVDGYETLVDALLQNQCGFDLIDDDALTDTKTRIEKGVCRAGPMTYRKILFPPSAKISQVTWLTESLFLFPKNGGVDCMD